jgi:hypothetical protein
VAVITEAMISITSIGTAHGGKPKINVRMNTPTMPQIPSPIPPTLAPMKISDRTTSSCMKIKNVNIGFTFI